LLNMLARPLYYFKHVGILGSRFASKNQRHIRKISTSAQSLEFANPLSSAQLRLITYSQKRSTPIKFQELCNMFVKCKPDKNKTDNKKLEQALFLKNEIPIRLAKLIGELESLPYGLSQTNSIRILRRIYISSFNQLVNYPIKDIERDHVPFEKLLKGILKNRFVVPVTAMGLHEIRRSNPSIPDISTSCPYLGQFLNKFFRSRIALRLLMGNVCYGQNGKEDNEGEIPKEINFEKIFEVTSADVTKICNNIYGRSPAIKVKNRIKGKFNYLPSHIYVILYELLKNSCRAVCEFHGHSKILPVIQVIVVGGEDEVVIKIQDMGGGIPQDQIEKIWLYAYSSAHISEEKWDDKGLVFDSQKRPIWDIHPGQIEQSTRKNHDVPTGDEQRNVDLLGVIAGSTMAGYGVGLPITRLHATLFGGRVELKSAHGHGVDTYVYLPHIRQDIPLPG